MNPQRNATDREAPRRRPAAAAARPTGGRIGVAVLGALLLPACTPDITVPRSVVILSPHVETQKGAATRVLLTRIDHTEVARNGRSHDFGAPGAPIAAYSVTGIETSLRHSGQPCCP
jgi:hypothetical protein